MYGLFKNALLRLRIYSLQTATKQGKNIKEPPYILPSMVMIPGAHDSKPFKVILINPAYTKIIQKEGMSFHYHKVVQPISLGYIASLCRSAGISVEIIDANVDQISSSADLWESLEGDLFLVSTASADNWQCPFLEIDDIKEIIQRLNTDNPVITLGPLVTEKPEEVLKILGKHVIGVRGEPEFTSFDLIKHIKEGKDWRGIDGISYTDTKTAVVKNNKDAADFDIKTLPRPAYDLLPMEKYRYEILGEHFCLMEASRGCSYKCNFCLKTMFRDVYKNRDPETIVADIKHVQEKYGVKNIFFIDLEFTIRKKETIAFCKEIVKQGVKIRYAIQARADRVDDDILYWLKKSGCCLIHFGVESGDPDILKHTNKMITIGAIRDGFARTKKIGIKTLAYFTIGHPPEKREDILKTISFSKELDPDYASFVIIIPYPGLPIYHGTSASPFYVGANDNMALGELEELRKQGIFEFYTRPQYIARRLTGIRSFDDVKVLWMGFTKLFLPLTRQRS
jgi:anaerobic magnesium-protoporphyrin IX monomethyl ester cyclase